MFILTNDLTGKSLKLSNKAAKEVFGLKEKHENLICLPAKKVIMKSRKNQMTIAVEGKFRGARKIGGTCVIRMGGIGDIAMLSSSLYKIKKENPDQLLTFATLDKHYKLFRGLRGVDKCIPISKIPNYVFDRVIDLRYAVEPMNIGPGSMTWYEYTNHDRSDNFDKLCGVNSRRKYFNLPFDAAKVKRWKKYLNQYKGPFIGFNPTCTSIYRAVPPEYVEPVVKRLVKTGTVILYGQTEGWNEYLIDLVDFRLVNLINKLNLPDLMAVSSLMDLVITPDTGALHIGAAFGCKVLGLFGNIDPMTRTTYYRKVETIFPKGRLNCIPCWDVPGACPTTLGNDYAGAPCMRLITPGRIAGAAERMLA